MTIIVPSQSCLLSFLHNPYMWPFSICKIFNLLVLYIFPGQCHTVIYNLAINMHSCQSTRINRQASQQCMHSSSNFVSSVFKVHYMCNGSALHVQSRYPGNTLVLQCRYAQGMSEVCFRYSQGMPRLWF